MNIYTLHVSIVNPRFSTLKCCHSEDLLKLEIVMVLIEDAKSTVKTCVLQMKNKNHGHNIIPIMGIMLSLICCGSICLFCQLAVGGWFAGFMVADVSSEVHGLLHWEWLRVLSE